MTDRAAGRAALERFLTTDPRDAGCAETFAMLDVWAELTLRGDRPEEQLPRIAAHLAGCDPCGHDLAGLLAAINLHA